MHSDIKYLLAKTPKYLIIQKNSFYNYDLSYLFVPSKFEVYPQEWNIFEIFFPMVLDGVVSYDLLFPSIKNKISVKKNFHLLRFVLL